MDMNDLILISVDDHNVEPPDAFTRHFPQAHRDKAPRVVQDRGKDKWLFNDRLHPTVGSNAVVGRPRSEYGIEPDEFRQMRKGCYDPKARVDDMNVNGVLAALNFPTFPQFAGGTFLSNPGELSLMGVRAYNDWHIHDWCATAPGRFIPLAILPLWDINETLAEVKRVSQLGVHAVTFPDNPTKAGLPSIHNEYWEPLWKAFVDHQIVVNCHIGSGVSAPHASDDSPIPAWITTMPISIVNSAADWLYAPMWKKYPTLKMALSEGGIGWIPYFLERADYTHDRHSVWTNTDFGGEKPSEVFKRHIITCFIDDKAGLEQLHNMNEDLIMWECDYPHSDTLWPDCPEWMWASFKTLPKATVDKITHLNAMREFSFDAFTLMGGRENCTVGALRELGKDVDTTPRAGQGGAVADGMGRRPITSGDMARLMARA